MSALDHYAGADTVTRKILDMHYAGKAPSEIDKELKLVPGTAHDEVVMYWDYCNPNPKREVKQKNEVGA